MEADNDKIMCLVSTFDDPRSTLFNRYFLRNLEGWEPETEKEKEAFAELIAPENRQALKEWYARHLEINDMAEAFRHILEKAIGEPLPLGKKR